MPLDEQNEVRSTFDELIKGTGESITTEKGIEVWNKVVDTFLSKPKPEPEPDAEGEEIIEEIPF